jgi:hypothetical protein
MFRAKRRLATLVSAALLFGFCIVIPSTSRASNPCPNTDAFNGITGLSLWLRADCVTGNAADPADNSTVNTWTDLSGLGNNATRQSGTPTFQSDSANLINSQPVVYFDGSSTFTSIDIRAITRPSVTIFAVYKLRSTNTVGVWGIDDGSWDRFFMARWSGDNGIISHSGTTNVPNSGQNGVTKFITTIYKYNVGSGSSVYDNGTLVSSFTDTAAESAAQTTLRIGSIGAIGGGYQLIGDIAELIIFDQVMSDADRKTVNGYLNTKYNLGMSAGNIPVNLVFNSLTLSGSASFRKAVTITANVSAAAKVTFKARNSIIPGCKNKATTGTSPNIVATCSWKPSTRGSVPITATAVPTGAAGSGTTATPITATVSNRTTSRG